MRSASFFRLQGPTVAGCVLCEDRREQSSRSENQAAGMKTDWWREVTTEPELEQSCEAIEEGRIQHMFRRSSQHDTAAGWMGVGGGGGLEGDISVCGSGLSAVN